MKDFLFDRFSQSSYVQLTAVLFVIVAALATNSPSDVHSIASDSLSPPSTEELVRAATDSQTSSEVDPNELQKDLQAYYRFDEPNFSSGYSIEFNGETDWVETAGPENLSSYTISVWFKADSENGERHIFQDSDGSPNSHTHGSPNVGVDPSGVYFTGGYNGTTYDKIDYSIEKGNWYHAVLISDSAGTSLSAYVNGNYIGDTHWTDGSALNLSNSTIGARPEKAKNNPSEIHHFDGPIDGVRVYDYSLSSSQVRDLYQNKRVSDPLALYRFDEGPKNCDLTSESSCTKDGSIQKNHATPRNFSSNNLDSGNGWSANTPLRRPVFKDYSGENRSGFFYGGKDGQLKNFDFNSSSGWTSGVKESSALKFDGEDDYVSLSEEDSFNLTEEITLSAWIKQDGVTDTYNKIISKRSGNNFWFIATKSGGFYGCIGDGGDNCPGGYPIENGKWHHVALTYSESTGIRELYIDGEMIESENTSRNLTSFKADTTIGADKEGSAGFFDGAIDDTRIYNRDLSSSEIKSLYDEAKVREGLVGEWSFNEGNGYTAYDTSSLENNGLLGTNTVDFDGSDDYVLTDWEGLTGNSSRTVSLWFKGDDSRSHSWIKWGEDTNGKKYHIRANPGDGSCYLRVENAGGQKYGDTKVCDDRWHHLAVVLPNGSDSVQDHILYVDGRKEKNTFGGDQALNTSGQNRVHLGHPLHHHDFLKGKMDEVRIYNRSLSQGEIKRLTFN